MMEASRTSVPLVEALPASRAALETVGYLPGRSRRALRTTTRADLSWAVARLTIDAVMLAASTLAASVAAGAAGLASTPTLWTAVFAALALGILHARGAY